MITRKAGKSSFGPAEGDFPVFLGKCIKKGAPNNRVKRAVSLLAVLQSILPLLDKVDCTKHDMGESEA